MTLVVAMKSIGGIVLAADSRGTIGDPRGLTAINDNQMKLYQAGKCGVGLTGSSEMGASLLDELRKNGLDQLTNIDDAVTLLSSRPAALFNQWFHGIQPEQRPLTLLTVAGYRIENGTPRPMIFMMNSALNFAPQLFDNTPCMSGVPQYAVYLVHRYYDASITLEKAKAFAQYLIYETASQDPKVGGPIKIAVITPDTGYVDLIDEELKQISRENEALNLQLREFFLKGVVV